MILHGSIGAVRPAVKRLGIHNKLSVLEFTFDGNAFFSGEAFHTVNVEALSFFLGTDYPGICSLTTGNGPATNEFGIHIFNTGFILAQAGRQRENGRSFCKSVEFIVRLIYAIYNQADNNLVIGIAIVDSLIFGTGKGNLIVLHCTGCQDVRIIVVL